MKAAQNIKIKKPKLLMEEISQFFQDFLVPEKSATQVKKRKQILSAATKLFIDHGYRKTSIDEIASAAGIAKGTVYLYYKNKAELLFHAIAMQQQLYLDELATILISPLSPVDQLHKVISLSITLSYKIPLIARVTGGDHEIEIVLQEVDNNILLRINNIKIDFISQMIIAASDRPYSQEQVETNAKLLLDLIFAVANGGRMIQSEMSIEEYSEKIADLVIEGIIP